MTPDATTTDAIDIAIRPLMRAVRVYGTLCHDQGLGLEVEGLPAQYVRVQAAALALASSDAATSLAATAQRLREALEATRYALAHAIRRDHEHKPGICGGCDEGEAALRTARAALTDTDGARQDARTGT